jgi:N,N'-diacetyllegionaminate synthase
MPQRPGRVYIIAEAGINHGGDIAVARRMVEVAAKAGVDAVKFQSFTAKGLTHEKLASDQHEFFSKYELTREEHTRLADACRENGVDFLSTPFDFEMVDLLDSLGVPAFKIASSDLTFLPLIEYAAAKGKPMYISTGMGNIEESKIACSVALQHGCPRVVLLQCTTNYPTAYADVNLLAMHTLRAHIGSEIGFSDHSVGNYCCFAAVALGATVIEKHFCLDKSVAGPDIPGSAGPQELADLVAGIRSIELALGSGTKAMRESEKDVAVVARRSIYYTAVLAAGHVLERRDFIFLRPGSGLPPADVDQLLGHPLAKDVAAGAMAQLSDIEKY